MSEAQQPTPLVHRPGLFKLPQKKHSTGRHRSKRAIARGQRGKVGVKAQTQQKQKELGKIERRNRVAQMRACKGAKMLDERRREGGAPILVLLISLDQARDARNIVDELSASDPDASFLVDEQRHIFHLSVPKFKSRYTFLCPNSKSTIDALDCLRVADLLLVFWPLNTTSLLPTQEGLLSILQAQGVPQTINLVSGLPASGKQRDSLKKILSEIMGSWSKNDGTKVHDLNGPNDGLQILRQISTVKKSHSNLQRQRPYLIAENIQTIAAADTSSSLCTLRVSGFLHGTPLSVNRLVHIPGWGDFQLSQIDVEEDPRPLKKPRNEMTDSSQSLLVIRADPSKQTPLDSEIIPDPMDADQPCLDDDELENKFLQPKVKQKVPKGTSEYQASWLINDAVEEEADEDQEDDEQTDDEEETINQQNLSEQMMEQEEEYDGANADEDIRSELMSTTTTGMDTDEIAEAEKEAMDDAQVQRFRQERENLQWPDEVETPKENARQRFQRYRGLKSFRTSPWDPKENLPREYARIYKILDFKRTRKLAFAESKAAFEVTDTNEFVFPGAYVTLHIANVPAHLNDQICHHSPLLVFGLLKHEHRMSVLNLVLQKHPAFSLPVKSKDELVFQVGCRRFTANPIFSQHTNGQKFKMERFMPSNGAFCATIFAPITYPPANVVVFRRNSVTSSLQLLANGIVLNVNPDRIILKRIVLSGHPYKVNKRAAVVRYMFFNREDVDWFKPIELYTHKGRRGRIRQALGTHGLMKCLFDQPMNVQDSVLMNLYKRIFPKWTYNPVVKEEVDDHSIGA